MRAAGLGEPRPISRDCDIQAFQCGDEELDRHLPRAWQGYRGAAGTTETVVVCAGHRVAAYYAIRPGSIYRAQPPGAASEPESVALTMLVRFAIDRAWQNRGIAADLFAHLVRQAFLGRHQTGSRLVYGYPVSDRARALYLRLGTEPVLRLVDPRGMTVPFAAVEKIAAATPEAPRPDFGNR